ncbi:unnamed protein product [Schistosoma guineensis]|nr:unnamed protein product [Schistosoma guineensis]
MKVIILSEGLEADEEPKEIYMFGSGNIIFAHVNVPILPEEMNKLLELKVEQNILSHALVNAVLQTWEGQIRKQEHLNNTVLV